MKTTLKDSEIVSPDFSPVTLRGNASWEQADQLGLFGESGNLLTHAPRGAQVFWGLPFRINRPLCLQESDRGTTVTVGDLTAEWLVFAHTSSSRPLVQDRHGLIETRTGHGRLMEHAADYVLCYADGSEERLPIRRRHEVGAFATAFGRHCVEAVTHGNPRPLSSPGGDGSESWGRSQTRASADDAHRVTYWLWAWHNPRPRTPITAIRFEPRSGAILVAGLSAGRASSHPLRWRSRRKALLTLPRGTPFDLTIDARGELAGLRLDMGQVISAEKRPVYPNEVWPKTYNNALPEMSSRDFLVEYTSHEDARFHLPGRKPVPVARVEASDRSRPLRLVPPADRTVTIRVVEKGSGRPVAAKLHVHGEAGEYLPPNVLHRLPNSSWFEDYSPEFQHNDIHRCVYIDGETKVRVPVGRVYIEVSKGFEIRPIRKALTIGKSTRTVTIEVDKELAWREQGWVSADTHVHFLSPQTGLLEGAAEGVNVVNLLASQWGELMTNVGDYDGRTVFGSKQAGGDGEYLLRVGTENRQHVLGHISLVGYGGPIIAPMTTGGPAESAVGDAIEVLLTEWARQCKEQDGVVVIPHFPNPRLEHAATIVSGAADAVEMTSWGDLYSGINPYSLSDWYRYLNNGYLTAAVGGTDKMSASTAVGTIRTYARVPTGRPFTYDNWMKAIRRAETFVTYGPLMDVQVEGQRLGSRVRMSRAGGTVTVNWRVASVTVPMSSVELVANGEVIDGRAVRAEADEGSFTVNVDRCTWLALLVRGHYADKPEMIAAHSSPAMVDVAGTHFYAAADSLSILQQIEGSLAYLDTVGTRAEDSVYRRMRLCLTSIQRELHNRMHRLGHDHPSEA